MVLSKDISKTIEDLKFTMKIESYPVLRDLIEIKDFYNYLEENLNSKKIEIEEKAKEISRDDILGLLFLESVSSVESKKSVNRSSLLMFLCAYVENVFMSKILSDVELKRKYKDLKNENTSTLQKAIKVLKEKYQGLDSIVLKDIEEMNQIRNKFVHQYGIVYTDNEKANLKSKLNGYDWGIIDDSIVLGDNFIPKCIEHLESKLYKVVIVLYEDESWHNEFLKKHHISYVNGTELIDKLKGIDSETMKLLVSVPPSYFDWLIRKSKD